MVWPTNWLSGLCSTSPPPAAHCAAWSATLFADAPHSSLFRTNGTCCRNAEQSCRIAVSEA
eukprot:scaffold14398_cov83-Phaeocystis_antarctica.AAC.3